MRARAREVGIRKFCPLARNSMYDWAKLDVIIQIEPAHYSREKVGNSMTHPEPLLKRRHDMSWSAGEACNLNLASVLCQIPDDMSSVAELPT